MQFLNADQHDDWLKNHFPKLQTKLYGFKEGEYITVNSGLKAGDFPIVDTSQKDENSPAFRAIIKLTNEKIPTKYTFTEDEKEIISSIGVITYQVLVIQVDDELNYIEDGHFSMNSIRY